MKQPKYNKTSKEAGYKNRLEKLTDVLAENVSRFNTAINAYSTKEVLWILQVHPLPYLRINLHLSEQEEPEDTETRICRQWEAKNLKELQVYFTGRINKSLVETLSSLEVALRITCQKLKPEYVLTAAKLLRSGQQVHIAHTMYNNEVKERFASLLKSELIHSSHLESLLLSWSNLGSIVGKAVGEGILVNNSLRVLYLGKIALGNEGLSTLTEALRVNKSIRTLSLRDNNIQSSGAIELFQSLTCNTTLKEVFLNQNSIGDDAACILGQSLRQNHSLTILQLCSNNIGSDGANALAQGLKSNKSLRMLNMNNNVIGDKGASALGQALKVNSSLEEVYLKNCEIQFEGAESFALSLIENKTLNVIDLRDNSICDQGGILFRSALLINMNLQGLMLEFNFVSENILRQVNELLNQHKRHNFRPMHWGKSSSPCTLSFHLRFEHN